MKKLIALLLLSSILLTIPSYASEIDLTQYSIEDLVALRDRITEELANKGYTESEIMPSGEYVAGKDIAVGTYDISYVPSEDENAYNWASMHIYPSETQTNYEDELESYVLGAQNCRIRLEEGNLLELICYSGTVYISKAPESSIFMQ